MMIPRTRKAFAVNPPSRCPSQVRGVRVKLGAIIWRSTLGTSAASTTPTVLRMPPDLIAIPAFVVAPDFCVRVVPRASCGVPQSALPRGCACRGTCQSPRCRAVPRGVAEILRSRCYLLEKEMLGWRQRGRAGVSHSKLLTPVPRRIRACKSWRPRPRTPLTRPRLGVYIRKSPTLGLTNRSLWPIQTHPGTATLKQALPRHPARSQLFPVREKHRRQGPPLFLFAPLPLPNVLYFRPHAPHVPAAPHRLEASLVLLGR